MANEVSPAIEFCRFLGQLISIGAGWYVVHRLSSKRDLEKSRRDLLAAATDSLAELVDKIHEQARLYHSSNRDNIIEIRIKLGLQDLAYRATNLNEIVEEKLCEKTWQGITPFRQAITKSHFEDEHLHPLNELDNQYERIAEEALNLKRALIDLKHSQYSLKSYQSFFKQS